MTYTYQELCEWRREAQIELKKQRKKVNKTKGFSDRVDSMKKGLGFFGKICESGVLQNLIERFSK